MTLVCAFLLAPITLVAVDLLDAPGPGYRGQNGGLHDPPFAHQDVKTALSPAPGLAQVTQFMDAPGPGYRMQSGRQPVVPAHRLELLPRPAKSVPQGGAEGWFLRTHPSLKEEWDTWHAEREGTSFKQELHQLIDSVSLPTFQDAQPARDLDWLKSELHKLTDTLPEFPRDDVFAAPRKLFGAP